jgi:hypothetical protein
MTNPLPSGIHSQPRSDIEREQSRSEIHPEFRGSGAVFFHGVMHYVFGTDL